MIKVTFFDSNNWRQSVELPESWNDFDRSEIQILRKTLARAHTQQQLISEILLYRIGRDISKYPVNFLNTLDIEDAALELLAIVEHWMTGNKLTKNPLPRLGNYYGPADDFNDLLCGEYEDADVHFTLYTINKRYDHLIDLVALLWRPMIDGKRISVEDYNPDKSFFKALDNGTLQMLFLWFSGCRQHLFDLFPEVFLATPKQENDESDLELGLFTRLVHSAAGERNGSRSDIRYRTTIKELLFDCQLQIEQNRDLEEKLNKK